MSQRIMEKRDRLHYVNILKHTAMKDLGKAKEAKLKLIFRKLLTENELQEIGGKLTQLELNYIFDKEPIYRTEHKVHRDNEPKWIAFCDTCGRYASMRWWFEQPPQLEDMWKEFVSEEQLYSTKDTIMDCLIQKHVVVVRAFAELEVIKEEALAKRMDNREKVLVAKAESLLDSIFDR